jgi:hypothetical protein
MDIGDFAVGDDRALPRDMFDKAMDRTVEHHLCAGSVQTPTVIVVVVGLLVVGHMDWLSGVHRRGMWDEICEATTLSSNVAVNLNSIWL